MRVVIGGDVYLGGRLERCAIETPENLWSDVFPYFASADVGIVNLESPLTSTHAPISKTGPHLRAMPEAVNALRSARVSVAALANNHIFDHGNIGLRDTLTVCRAWKIDTVGAGMDVSEARKTLYKKVGDEVLAVINVCENEWSVARHGNGGANSYDVIEIVRQLQVARSQADYVLLIVHGGHELCYYPSPRIVREFRFFAEHGASAIVCHHSHCLSGFEVHQGVPIFYGLGNLLFDSETSPQGWNQGLLVSMDFRRGEVPSWDLVPVEQPVGEFGLQLVSGAARESVLIMLGKINEAIMDPELLREKWNGFVVERMGLYLGTAIIPWTLPRRVLGRLKLTKWIGDRLDLRALENYIRCESHRDAMLRVLELQREE